MDFNITKLRELIRTGEYLKDHYNDEDVLTRWVFDVSFFTEDLDSSTKRMIHAQLHQLQTVPSDYIGNRDNQKKIVGFLISLYNNCADLNLYTARDSQSVFIVHGHDNALIDSVKDCITELGLKPIVLREQPNHGMTIIEKLEDWLGNCKAAIVLYTPCDVGRAVSEREDEVRARQNVVYEHGLFQGYLGRRRIIILRKGSTALPGDDAGMVYISTDNENWQVELKKNIEAIDK